MGMPLLFRLLLVLLFVVGGRTFTSLRFRLPGRTPPTSLSRLFYSLQNSEGNAPEELQKLAQARAAFEALISNHLSSTSNNTTGSNNSGPFTVTIRSPHGYGSHDDNNVNQYLLTSTGRRKRELEMSLLDTLRHSDSAIEELIHLWTTERDQQASTALLAMQNSQCSQGLVEEEEALRDMCDLYPGWAEPYSRLATLLYYTGRVQESVAALDAALGLKPWHFEALAMGVLLAQDESVAEHVRAQAAHFCDMVMPPVEDAAARNEWVTAALRKAAQQLQDAEDATTVAQQQQQAPLFGELKRSEIWQ